MRLNDDLQFPSARNGHMWLPYKLLFILADNFFSEKRLPDVGLII